MESLEAHLAQAKPEPDSLWQNRPSEPSATQDAMYYDLGLYKSEAIDGTQCHKNLQRIDLHLWWHIQHLKI
jgi:hypothetical protein